jgi:hypothetical protein
LGIVIELDTGPNLQIRIRGAQFVDLIKIHSGVITIVIGECDIVQSLHAGAVYPGLQEFLRIRLNSMSLRMAMVVAEKSVVDR